MYTRCTACESVFQLRAADLAEAGGVVRCGNCGKTYNALVNLFHEHPDSGEMPLSGGGMPPLLDQRSTVQPELPGVRLEPQQPHQPPPVLHFDEANDPRSSGRVWPALVGLLAVGLVAQMVYYARHPDFSLERSADPGGQLLASPDSIQILSRDLHRHPSLDDAIIISLTLANTGDRAVTWPLLELRLFDPSQQVLGVRRLAPGDYLERPDRLEQGMAPGLIVPVIVEVVVGATEPSGFDFRFY
ncbi:MAG: zinc-ribbon and DUF3426 domain-containing protein [Wenzhouxiangella sp.]|nr:zinc-ribbon and DUF3426 domain-containing protein [Wenzhouxiangella sp.]